jgi:hypothetical protein
MFIAILYAIYYLMFAEIAGNRGLTFTPYRLSDAVAGTGQRPVAAFGTRGFQNFSLFLIP